MLSLDELAGLVPANNIRHGAGTRGEVVSIGIADLRPEDAATVRALAEIGVDYVQGYAIARPLAPERILQATSSASSSEDERLAAFTRARAAGPSLAFTPATPAS